MLSKNLIPLSEFRASASSLISSLKEQSDKAIVITQNGRAAAVLLSVQEYQELLQTVEDLKSMVSNLLEVTDESKLIPGEEVLRHTKEELERQRKLQEALGAV